ncbi:MAG: hypothetical protein HY363_00770 [Candidatus Aenigmarchaeota archaeon]|nr:hypothetical protein [Candidatus Aenigmarchaeota archaeon]
MSFINHNVNLGLLFLILMTTTMMVTSAVFFQVKYDQVVQEYNSQVSLMDELADELQFHQSALGKVNDALKLAQEREQALRSITAKISSERQKRTSRVDASAPVVRQSVRQNPAGTEVNLAFASRPKSSAFAGIAGF